MRATLYVISILASMAIMYKHISRQDIQCNIIGVLFMFVTSFIPLANLGLALTCVGQWRD